MTEPLVQIRRVFTQVEDIVHEFGPSPAAAGGRPLRRGVIGIVVTNPFAGRYEPDILPMMDALGPVGIDMAQRLLAAMAVPAERIETYGKGAIVGAAGELEHGALWHVPGGYAMRELLGWKEEAEGVDPSIRTGLEDVSLQPAATQSDVSKPPRSEAPKDAQRRANALAIVPSTKKVGPPGATLDVPLTHINASYVRSHFDAVEVRVPGAPLANEIVYILAMSTGPRVHARVGGLAADAIARWDGLR